MRQLQNVINYKCAYIGLVIFLFVFNTIFVIKGNWGHDFWEHAAVLKSLSKNVTNSIHPILGTNQPHPFYTPYHILLSFLAKCFGITNFDILGLASFFNLTLLLFGLNRFIGAFINEKKSKWTYYFIFLFLNLFLWSFPWVWSSFINFKSLFYVLPYPSTFALGLGLATIPFAVKEKKYSILILTLLSLILTLLLLIHPLTFLSFSLLLCAIVFANNYDLIIKLKLGLALLFSILFAYTWPFSNILEIVLDSTIDKTQVHLDSKVLFQFPLLRALPIFILIPMFWKQLLKKEVLPLFICFGGIIYTVSWISGQYGYGRMISLVYISLILIYSLNYKEFLKCTNKYYSIATLILLCFFMVSSFYGLYKKVLRSPSIFTSFASINSYIPESSTVLVPEEIINYFPAFSIHTVGTVFPAYWILDNEKRRLKNTAFFSSSTSELQKKEIVNEYRVQFIVTKNKEDFENVSELSFVKLVSNSASLQIFEIIQNAQNITEYEK